MVTGVSLSEATLRSWTCLLLEVADSIQLNISFGTWCSCWTGFAPVSE